MTRTRKPARASSIAVGAESGTLLAIDRARQVLGCAPRYSWRDY